MKTLKFIAFATILSMPVSASAMCSYGFHEASATPICADGQVYDEAAEACVDTVG